MAESELRRLSHLTQQSLSFYRGIRCPNRRQRGRDDRWRAEYL